MEDRVGKTLLEKKIIIISKTIATYSNNKYLGMRRNKKIQNNKKTYLYKAKT
jgi:hypothetical protein